MTTTGFPSLPTELVLQIASHAKASSLLSLLLCNSALHDILMPVLHTRALAPYRRQSAIQWAANRDHIGLVKLVLARGMHPDTGSTITKGPALRSAVRDGSLEIAELLLTHGADVNRKTFHGRLESVIHLAAANGDTAMIKLLAAHGADLAVQNLTDSCRGTPLHIAVICNQVSAVRTLLDLHVPVDAENYAHRTPLDVATSFACYDLDQLERVQGMVLIGRMLVQAGARMQCHEGGVGRPSRDRQDVEWQKELFAMKEGEDVSG